MELIELLYYAAWLIAGFYLGSTFETTRFIRFLEETDKLLQSSFDDLKTECERIQTKCLVQQNEIEQLRTLLTFKKGTK